MWGEEPDWDSVFSGGTDRLSEDGHDSELDAEGWWQFPRPEWEEFLVDCQRLFEEGQLLDRLSYDINFVIEY